MLITRIQPNDYLQVLTFTPDSSLSPPHQEDSEDESSFMTHTQVDLQHCGDLDLQHNGVDEGDLDQDSFDDEIEVKKHFKV